MTLPPGWRFLTDDEAKLDAAAGNADTRNSAINEATQEVKHITELGDLSDKSGNFVSRGAGLIARQVAGNVIPAVLGRGAGAIGGLAASSVAGAPVGEAGGLIPAAGTIGGMVLGGIGTKLAQDKLTSGYANRHPTSALADFVRASENDVRAHPYLSQIAALGTAPFAGGGPGVTLTKKGLSQAGAMAGLQTGIDAGGQMVANKSIDPTKLDPAQLAISAAGGGLMSRPTTGLRTLERAVLPKNKFTEAFAPALERPLPTSAIDIPGIEARAGADVVSAVDRDRMPLHLQPDWNPDYYVGADVKQLGTMKNDKLAKAVIRLKNAEVPIDANDITTLSKGSRDYEGAVDRMLKDKYMQLSGNAPATGAVANQLASATSGPIKSASQSAVDIGQAAKDSRVSKLAGMTPDELLSDGGADALAVKAMRDSGFAVSEETLRPLISGAKVVEIPGAIKKVVNVGMKAADMPPENKGTVSTIEDPIAQRKAELEATMKGITKVTAEPAIASGGSVVKPIDEEVAGVKKKEISNEVIPPPLPVTEPVAVPPVESTSVVTPPVTEERSAGIAPSVIKPIVDAASLSFRPGLTRLEDKLGPIGGYFKKKYEEMKVLSKQLINPVMDEVNKAESAGGNRNNVSEYIYARKDGRPLPVLTPEEAAAVKRYDDVVRVAAIQKGAPNSPLINGRVPISTPYYAPEMGNKLFYNAANNKLPPAETARVRQLFIDWQMNKGGASLEEATQHWNNATTKRGDTTPLNVEYGQLRNPEGIGYPPELRANAWDALKRMVTKQGMDLGWHRTIESDPTLGPAMGYPENGRGVPYPAGPDNSLGRDSDVRVAMMDYVGGVGTRNQAFETGDRLFKSMMVQTPTQVWNLAQTFSSLGELVKGFGDLPPIFTAAAKALTTKGQQESIRRGSVKGSRNFSYSQAEDARSLLNGALDMIQHITLSEPIEIAHRSFFDHYAKIISENRLRAGDTKFFDQWGPADWRSKSVAELTDYTANRITHSQAGGYDAEELPNALLKGSTNPVRPLFSLARWSIGRSNHFIDNVIKPLGHGELRPLIGSLTGGLLSASAVNYLKEKLVNQKPREMTWEEFNKVAESIDPNTKQKRGTQDVAYTLLSKANTAGYAGFMGSLAFNMLAGAKGESPQGFANPLIAASTEGIQRIGQYLNAVQNGDVGWIDGLGTLTLQLAQDRIQLARTLLDDKEDTGKREEAIAQRTGYLPPKSVEFGGHLTNPYGPTGAYRRGDVEGLRGLIMNKLARGQEPPLPTSALKQPGAYAFIRDAQGAGAQPGVPLAADPAVAARLEKDRQLSLKRAELFRQAIAGQSMP